MSIESPEELAALKKVGHICHLALDAMRKNVRAGITTAELASIGAKVMREHGARSAPVMVYGFPAEILVSVNDEAVHGVPSERRVEACGFSQARRHLRKGRLHGGCGDHSSSRASS